LCSIGGELIATPPFTMRAVAAVPALGLLAGSATGLFFFDFLTEVPAAAYVGLVMAAAAAVWAWRVGRPWVLAVAAGTVFFAGGALLAADAWREAWRPTLRVAFEALARADRAESERRGRPEPEDDSASAIVAGILRADASPRLTGVSLTLNTVAVCRPGLFRLRSPELEASVGETRQSGEAAKAVGPGEADVCREIPVNGGVLLTVAGQLATERMSEWRAGRTVRVPAQLRRPSRYLDPGVVDQERALARRGLTLVGSVKSGALVEVIARGSRVSELAADVRAFARRAIASGVGRWSPRSAAIVTAIVIGDRAGLDDEVQRRLQEAGTYHVIAISGGNIAILAGLTLAAFRIAGLLGRVAMLSAIAGLVAYGYLVGGGASVNRATLMAAVYFAARAIDLRGPPINALALVVAVLVAVQPLAVADPAFLLTCGATAAIILVASAMSATPRGWPRPVAALAGMFVASVSAEAALMPVGAYLFSRVTFAGLILNFAAIPLMAVAQIAGMLVLPAALFSGRAAAEVGWIAHLGADGLVRSADLVRFAPALTWRVTPPAWPAVISYYIGLIGAWTLWRLRAQVWGSAERPGARIVRHLAAATAAGAAVWILAEPWTFVASRADGRLHVTFVDVGQGDAALVRFPNGASLLVDAGGLPGSASFDIGERVVAPVLRHAGIRRLDTAAFTHGDSDHIGGGASVVGEFRPRDVWEGIPVPPFEPLHVLRAAATRVRAQWVSVQTNDRVGIGEVSLIVRHPPVADWERQDVRNDDSIVMELLWRDVSIVLTGDIGREVEQMIRPLFGPSRLRVLKVPHHGSLTSSSWDFVRALSPRVAVFSVGRGNVYGHPAPAVLDRYRRIGTEIFRTDQDGAITVDTDGYSLEIQTFTKRTLSLR
jgi:competence protein ComEC